MSESATLTLRLPSETKEQLALLANRTRRTSSFVAAEAIATYVTRELAIVEATEQGRAEIRAGKFTSHEDVAREAQILIKAARAKRWSAGLFGGKQRPRRLLGIIRYIAQENPDAAARVADGIDKAAAALADFAAGRAGRVVGTYEKVLSNLPNGMVYES